MRRIRVTVRVSRYQREKQLGEEWRQSGETCTFTEYRARVLGKKKKIK